MARVNEERRNNRELQALDEKLAEALTARGIECEANRGTRATHNKPHVRILCTLWQSEYMYDQWFCNKEEQEKFRGILGTPILAGRHGEAVNFQIYLDNVPKGNEDEVMRALAQMLPNPNEMVNDQVMQDLAKKEKHKPGHK